MDVAPLNPSEQAWLKELLIWSVDQGMAGDIAQLSDFFAARRSEWWATKQKKRLDPNPLINVVGAAVGQALVEQLGLSWVVATDEHGTELGVYGEPNSVLICPMDAVGKRWPLDAQTTVAEFFEGSIQAVRGLRQS